MPTARLASTGQSVSAEELWDRPGLRAMNFICDGCAVTVNAVGVPHEGQKEFLVRPYFRKARGAEHEDECGQDKQVELRRRALTQPVLSGPNPPRPIFSRLALSDLDEAAPSRSRRIPGQPEHAPICITDVGAGDDRPSSDRRNRTAWRLGLIARQFLDFPHDRDLPLEVPGQKGTYRTVFGGVQQILDSRRSPTGILFAKIGVSQLKPREGSILTVPLAAGEWGEENGRPRLRKRAHLRVSLGGWKKLAYQALLDELRITQEEERARVQFNEKDRASAEAGMIFFIGRRDADDPLIFHADDRRLICAMIGRFPSSGKRFSPN